MQLMCDPFCFIICINYCLGLDISFLIFDYIWFISVYNIYRIPSNTFFSHGFSFS